MSEMDDRLIDFLQLVKRQDWRDVPQIWNEQVRAALSENFITVGWGGVLKLTDAGKAALAAALPAIPMKETSS